MLVGKEFQRALVGFLGAFGDGSLVVEFEQLKVGRRDGADDGNLDGAPAFARGHEVGACRFIHPADATPEVDFPNRSESCQETIHGPTAIRNGQS